MAFPDRAMEQRFCEESLQSDAHYKIARWAFYLLSLLYLAYFSSVRVSWSPTQALVTSVAL